MLKTDAGVNLNLGSNDFRTTVEQCSLSPSVSDYMDFQSDEDFLQQLSSDLDIPLLLSSNEEEMGLLNSFFDKSPEEILSDISYASNEEFVGQELDDIEKFNLLNTEIKIEDSDSNISNSSSETCHTETDDFLVILQEKTNKINRVNSNKSLSIPTLFKQIPLIQSKNIMDNNLRKVPVIQPKRTCGNNIIVVNNANITESPTLLNAVTANVVMVDNVPTININEIKSVPPINSQVNNVGPPMYLNASSSLQYKLNNIDPKIWKRQQRKIKNRESACLSRKKKKDHLICLEQKIEELTAENTAIKKENLQLKSKLAQYENTGKQQFSKSSLNSNNRIVLYIFLFVIGINFNYLRLPNIGRKNIFLPGSIPVNNGYLGRSLLWAPSENDSLSQTNETTNLAYLICPAPINETESSRLVLELERWIGKPGNKTLGAKPISQNKFPKSKFVRKGKLNIEPPLGTGIFGIGGRLKKYSGWNTNNGLQVFSPPSEQMYSEFFEAINRQEDTFYVVSFSEHHMLLPALHHNRTMRPKMSLIMPSVVPANLPYPSMVPLMQIDCEVLNTRRIYVKYGTIPQHLRRTDNTTSYENKHGRRTVKNYTKHSKYTKRKAYKPYFVNQTYKNSNSDNLSVYSNDFH